MIPHSPPKIDLLPEHLIDQIKAGEVIERPGNLLKEILENSVDSKATKIEITIKNNGLDLICLKDNGHGMRFNDLPLAFSRHATSKISRFEDLYLLRSFGFRGEALASIAAISKVQCVSKVAQEKLGSEIRIDGGHVLFHQSRKVAGLVNGTELVIQDLFHNTPARLKFIQSATSEKQFIRKIIFSFVLSHPKIEFQIKFDDADKEIFPASESLLERIENLVPKAKSLIQHNVRQYENNEVEIFLVPGQFKTPVKWQNIFINDRLILDKQFHRVLCNALLATFNQDDFHYLVFFRVPADSIDVNVHPNKTLIKCLDNSKMISLLTSTVRELNKKPAISISAENSQNETLPYHSETLVPHLLQERHNYNMEGIFSPHGLDNAGSGEFYWIDHFFISNGLAYNAQKLLRTYLEEKLKTPSTVVPLLVSEPYSAKGISPERLNTLAHAGLEIEFLGSETVVLRGIPEWMTGFSLRECVTLLLYGTTPEINPKDWPESSWHSMLKELSTPALIESKSAIDLASLLREKLK